MNNGVRAAETPALRQIRAIAPQQPLRDHLPFGEPAGTPDRIAVTSTWLERGGKPWLPITGEVHYSRIPRDRWEETIAKAAAGGLNSIATYVLWNAHEPHQGEFHWDDNRDLRAFVEICARNGLDVIVRMGPWSHGEARYGGFPDWLMESGIETRTNDPQYLELARKLYSEIITQISGLTHSEGGPIVGVQIDNELYNDSQHLATLRIIAEELGLRVPLWSATGWGGAEVPATLFPLYSAYAEGFWEETDVEWPAFSAHHFRYAEVRDDLNVGKDLREALDGVVLDPDTIPLKDDSVIPFATCELGGGMHVAYHRRPLVTSDDVSKLALAKIGSGSIWQGYYMYAGGTIRTGPHGTEQESHATGYPNDVPTLNYDFYAPLGQHTQVRKHYHQLRRQHLWLNLDGQALAAMRTEIGGGSEDPNDLRWAIRSDGHRGYLFATTYQPAKSPINAQPGAHFAIDFDDETVTVPAAPIDLPQNVSVAWPVRFPVTDGLVLRYATADVLTRIADEDGDVLVLAATDGVRVELAFDGHHAVDGPVHVTAVGGHTIVELTAQPSPHTVVTVSGQRILILSEADSLETYTLHCAGRDRLVRSPQPVYVEADSLVLHPESRNASVSVFPPLKGVEVSEGLVQVTMDGLWATINLTVPEAGSHRIVENLAPQVAIDPQPAYGGPMNRLSAPTDFTHAAKVTVDVPAHLVTGTDRALLRMNWTGDVGRAVVDDEVIADQFWYGREWDIDLTPYAHALGKQSLELQLMPWKKDLGVWVDPAVRDVTDGITIASIDVVRIPRITITATLLDDEVNANDGVRKR